jgi:dTDP-4-dehydrorhamnose 3,5-epimerase
VERPLNALQTALPGVIVIETTPLSDHRGAFSRLYCERELAAVIGDRRIVQINHSRTAAVGAVRGMHYQRPPHAEMKLVRCLKGRVWDVAVDLRAGSPTFLQWHAEELSPGNARMMVIPEGCAHGFQVLEADSELLYLHTAFYAPEAEVGVSCNEPHLGISWPLPVTDLSQRDSRHPPMTADFPGIVV